MTEAQSSLIKNMREVDPRERVDIFSVVNQLKHQADIYSQHLALQKYKRSDMEGDSQVSVTSCRAVYYMLNFHSY